MKFIKKILNTIIIPYVIWALISISIYSIIGKSVTSSINTSMGNFSLIKNLWGMVYANSQTGFFNWNRPLWFLVCLVCVELIWYLLLSVFSKIKIRAAYIGFWVCMSISLIWMVSLAITKTYLRLPWEFETAVSMVFFFGIGLLLRCTEKLELLFAYLRKNKFVFIVLELSFIIINIVIAVINKDTDLRSDYYGNVFLYIPGALFGCMALLILAGTIKKQRLFEYTGTKTLAILVMNKFPIMFFKIILLKIGIQNNYIIAILMCILTLVLCLMAEFILSKILPWTFGIKKSNR